MLDLSPDIIGTNPKYIPIFNGDWLIPNKDTYNNYPSDNNSVRIQPKLSELWNNSGIQTGVNLVPNCQVMPLGSPQMGEPGVAPSVVREAKKAMMAGLGGSELASHIRSRFAAEDIAVAKEALVKLSEEQGLLGNVYIDVSAFSSGNEADQFFSMHRGRLARDVVVGEGVVGTDTAQFIANKYHKRVVASMVYDDALFARYKIHLVEAKKIDNNFVIDSKETLRAAFLASPVERENTFVANRKKYYTKSEISASLCSEEEKVKVAKRLLKEEMTFKFAFPIISFVREQLSKRKQASDLKEMISSKYMGKDIKKAEKYLRFVANEQLFTEANIDKLVSENIFTTKMGAGFKQLIKDFPIQSVELKEAETVAPIGVKAALYAMPKEKSVSSEICGKATDVLRAGHLMCDVRVALLKKYSSTEVDAILSKALIDFNASGAGVIANAPVIAVKEKVVADIVEPETLPNKNSVLSQNQELREFYANSVPNLEIEPTSSESSSLDIGLSGGGEGLDLILQN